MPSGDSATTITPPRSETTAAPRTLLCGLFQSRTCIVPTWRGWAMLLLTTAFLILFVGRHLYAFLAESESVPGGVLVIEGWLPSYADREALEEFHRHPYLGIYVSGYPIEEGSPYISYHNYAEFTVAKLVEMGAPTGSVHAAPAPAVERDRTYSMAATVKKQLEADGVSTAKINVVSFGPHSRRSRLLYQEAFGPSSQIGMFPVACREFDPEHWWRSSEGVRAVISEGIAYAYARLVFRPGAN